MRAKNVCIFIFTWLNILYKMFMPCRPHCFDGTVGYGVLHTLKHEEEWMEYLVKKKGGKYNIV